MFKKKIIIGLSFMVLLSIAAMAQEPMLADGYGHNDGYGYAADNAGSGIGMFADSTTNLYIAGAAVIVLIILIIIYRMNKKNRDDFYY